MLLPSRELLKEALASVLKISGNYLNRIQGSWRALLRHLRWCDKIEIITNTIVKKVNGQGHALSSVILENVNTGEQTEFPTDGAFVYIGSEPQTDIYREQINLDENQYVIAGEDARTNIEGVYVAGDIRTKAIRQVVTAAADGAIAGIMAERFVSSH